MDSFTVGKVWLQNNIALFGVMLILTCRLTTELCNEILENC